LKPKGIVSREGTETTLHLPRDNESLGRVSEYERREEEETQVGVDERTAQMWRERGIKGGREG
jgi:pyruvoyl-dependent arginine decarboxylase (PvlArgDC)